MAYIEIHLLDSRSARLVAFWIPAYAGMTAKMNKTSNNLEHPKNRISSQIQTVAEIFWSNLEHIKERGGKPLIHTRILTEHTQVCENR